MSRTWNSKEDLIKKNEYLRSKSASYMKQFEETIVHLNRLKEPMIKANANAAEENWKNIELNKIVHKLQKKKIMFLNQLITYHKNNKKELQMKVSFNWAKNKFTLVFTYEQKTIQVTHIRPRQVLRLSISVEEKKSLVNSITDLKLKNELFLTIKNFNQLKTRND